MQSLGATDGPRLFGFRAMPRNLVGIRHMPEKPAPQAGFARYNVRCCTLSERASRAAFAQWADLSDTPDTGEWWLAAENVEAACLSLLRRMAEAGGPTLHEDLAVPGRLLLYGAGPQLIAWAKELDAAAGATSKLGTALLEALDLYRWTLEHSPELQVMGIVNVTPDSFSDGGAFFEHEAAIRQGLQMAQQGAHWIDVGGESTRPGAEPVSEAEELRRVLPVVRALARVLPGRVSIDTRHAAVAAASVEAGAAVINDVSAMTHDPRMAEVAAASGATVALMHMLGTPETMQRAPEYEEVVADTLRYLRERAEAAMDAGVAPENIWIDPGFGFGKTLEHNLEILRRLREYTSAGFPVLLGTSRKSTLGRILGGLPADERLEATAATVALAAASGVNIVRVHDVKEMSRVARTVDAIVRGWSPPTGG